MDDHAPTEFKELDTDLDEILGPPFSALVYTSHGAPVVRVRGELDMATVPRLGDAIGVACSRLNGGPVLIVDLRDIEFIDVTGVRSLVEEALAMEGLGGELRLTIPEIGSVSRLFGLLGVERMCRLHHDLGPEPSLNGHPEQRVG